MKILTKLEKTKATWFLIVACTIFFLLRLPSIIEPYWYGDEGIYQVMSLALNNGWGLYSDIWDNKPPLLYATYALFSGDQFVIRLVSLLLGLVSVIIFFFFSRQILQTTKAAIIATSVLTVLFSTPYIEGNIANAENFMLPLILFAGFLIYKYSKKPATLLHSSDHTLFIAGLLLGIAFLFKIVAIFDLAAFMIFLLVVKLPHERITITSFVRYSSSYLVPTLVGFFAPIILTFIYFMLHGTVASFIQAAFFGNVDYVGYNNNFIIPQGFLILKVCLFVMIMTLLFIFRKAFTKPVLFITLWFVFALFSAFFSQRPYTHYLLVILPSFCLLSGLFFTKQTMMAKLRIGTALVAVGIVAVIYFDDYGVKKTFQYYQNTIEFLTGKKSVNDYQAFFDPETPRDYELVSYINNHTSPSDTIFLWGDSPQIYYLTKKLPPGRYTVSYHILQDPDGIAQTQAAIDKTQPKFIITLSEAPPLPFRLGSYSGIYGIQGAAIYERTY